MAQGIRNAERHGQNINIVRLFRAAPTERDVDEVIFAGLVDANTGSGWAERMQEQRAKILARIAGIGQRWTEGTGDIDASGEDWHCTLEPREVMENRRRR